jgi:site-specific recombinase XerD
MISLYRRHYRPRLHGAERTSYLFPAKRGHMTGQGFAAGIKDLVKARLGVHISPHLWRHLMSSKLGETTGRAEDAGKLLGHAAGSAATKVYARLKTRTAAEQLGEIVEQTRKHGAALLRARAKGGARRKHPGGTRREPHRR